METAAGRRGRRVAAAGRRGMETAAGGRGMETAAGRRDVRSLLDIKSAMAKLEAELYGFLEAAQETACQEFKRERSNFLVELAGLKDFLQNCAAHLLRINNRTDAIAFLEKQGTEVESSTTDTQVMWILLEYIFDAVFGEFRKLRGRVSMMPASDERSTINILITESCAKLQRIKLETRLKVDNIIEEDAQRITMDTAEGSQSELISNEVGEEGATCIDKAAAELEEVEQANEMGEESATCIEKAEELEIEVEEKMETNQFFDISCRMFLANLSNLFSRPWEDMTSLSPMHFTHTTPPGDAASVAATLQIFSVQLQEINMEALESNWPLCVYGTVAARDTVDHNLNILFHRERDNCQMLTLKDAFLQLTGPSRAIVAMDPVDFEIELKVKGSGKKASEDRVLMRQILVYSCGNNEMTTLLGNNDCCTIMLRCAKLENTVQATVVAVRVINWRKRAWPFKNGGKVSCFAKGPVVKPEDRKEVVLQDELAGSTSYDGYLDLSRRAVSVELNGQLRVSIHSSKSCGNVFFLAQESKSSRCICHLGPYEVEVTVAWSLPIRDRRCFISREECVDDGQAFKHTANEIRRRKTPLLETQSAREIYSLLDLISKNAIKLKTEPKLRISDYSISEVKMHMNYMYSDVTSLLRMMENVHSNMGQEQVTENMGVNTRTEDKGESATEKMQAPRTYYKYRSNAIFNGLDQLCTQLDQMGLLSYKGRSQLFSKLSRDDITKLKLDEIELPVEAAKGKNEVSIEEAKEMGVEEEDSDVCQTEEEYFESYRQSWVYNWSISCGTFTETTSLSPMHFTHSIPGHKPSGAMVGSTLQIYSIKVCLEKDSGLNWPLQVYGIVAARDTVDRNRNILFSRQRNNCQELTTEDPFLHLTGPSRAIVTREPPHVEIELKVKGTTESEDSVLMSHFWSHSSISYIGLDTLYIPLEGDCCTVVLSTEELGKSVQATIVGIHVRVPEGRQRPFEYGGRVVCSSLPRTKGRLPDSEHIADDPSFRQVVLQDGEMAICSKGYLSLSRHVVSVKLQGKLEVVIQARSQPGAMAGQVVASIEAQECNISEDVCHLGDYELKITVAWSRLVKDKALVSTL